MNPMKEAWALLKGNPLYQAQQAGTNQPGAGGSLPQQFMSNPGRTYTDSAYHETRPSGNLGHHADMLNSPRGPYEYERQPHSPVTGERSFQSLQAMPGQQESNISRLPKQGLLERRRDKKQKKLADRAERTGKGKDYRAAYPIDASQGSVFDPR
jgi:hypothetical protein